MAYVILVKTKSKKNRKVVIRKTTTIPYSWKKYDEQGYRYFDTVSTWKHAETIMRALKGHHLNPDTLRPLAGCWRYIGQPKAGPATVRWSAPKSGSDFVYGLYKDHTLVYIGVTNSPDKRCEQHFKSGKLFDYLEVLSSHPSRKEADAFEVFSIYNIRPPLNRLVLPETTDFCFALTDLDVF